ncbi:C40 family peptidase [Pseudooceanicola sp. CBS1P-1]|uniref:NLP/P60 hydrolase n=1 Tax=Pseudooceanicola albus TaxID=2692189 RepID=A0A6L7G8S8_9RHOB|nr:MULTISPECIES: NlpC/P60 family protein [Pseudooceanicola]MBT9384094.1 C40 family peptidase [Pseudooceanicola endophyticus]MXN19806.1 NLP/P60 hydrolase [Pseudooceanicola albus]
MSAPDRRRWPCNGRVAAERLRGQAEARHFTAGELCRVKAPAADLLDAPGGARDRQLLHGDEVLVYEVREGMAFLEARKDGYTGYLEAAALAPDRPGARPNAAVRLRETLCYDRPSARSMASGRLSLGARVLVESLEDGWARTGAGYIPAAHLDLDLRPEVDPVAVSARLLGMPYLWGANGFGGIDCSGLVQAGCLACGIACPGDSDMQSRELGDPLPADAPLARGDLLFWKGHVAWVADPRTILHANGHSMSVAYEGLPEAIARIAASDGPVTARRRLPGLDARLARASAHFLVPNTSGGSAAG